MFGHLDCTDTGAVDGMKFACPGNKGGAPARAKYHSLLSGVVGVFIEGLFSEDGFAGAAAVLEDRAFPLAKVLDFQRTFLRRFFLTSQFKRTCVPNAPKVGDGGSLSPRGDWRAPSDSSWQPWHRGWQATVKWARASAAADGHAELARDLEALMSVYEL